jgi:hypothetical protein
MTAATRPHAGEFAPYYGRYIALVPEDHALAALERPLGEMIPFLSGLTEAQGALRYAPDKWSVKQVIGHVVDVERVFAYRALRIARGDDTPLAGFDENGYAAQAGSDRLALRALVDELDLVRRANLAMFRGLPDEAWARRGTANQSPFSVRALAYVIAGHARHHARIIRERYLGGSRA